MKRAPRAQAFAAAILLGVGGCSGEPSDGGPGLTGTGGAFSGTGGTGAAVTGGLAAQGSGGLGVATGGMATGGNVATGGVTQSGGRLGAGGSVQSGGITPTGGMAQTGGDMETGGAFDTGGTMDTGGADHQQAPTCELPDASVFQTNNVGRGGSVTAASEHFQIFGSASNAEAALNHLEAAHQCFVEDWCFRSPGQSVHEQDGPFSKFNVYSVGTLGGAAGVMQYDARAGLSYLEVIGRSLAEPRVVVHEFGHALTLTEYGWVEQTRTGAWWETVANWVADTYITSDYCADARDAFGISAGSTIINLDKTIGQAHMMIVSDQNLYEAWPFLAYLTHNPDHYAGLGRMILPEMFRNHTGNNETPLHVLEKLAAPISVQTILGRYWARMAYLDIGHPKAQEAFFSRRSRLNFANLDSSGNQTYQVNPNRRPAYGGANIIPLNGQGDVSVAVTNLGNGLRESNFTATLAIRAGSGAVRYIDLPDGTGAATIGNDEEASLVVVNTPDTLYQYDPFQARSPETVGLNYRVQITGAVPAQ